MDVCFTGYSIICAKTGLFYYVIINILLIKITELILFINFSCFLPSSFPFKCQSPFYFFVSFSQYFYFFLTMMNSPYANKYVNEEHCHVQIVQKSLKTRLLNDLMKVLKNSPKELTFSNVNNCVQNHRKRMQKSKENLHV